MENNKNDKNINLDYKKMADMTPEITDQGLKKKQQDEILDFDNESVESIVDKISSNAQFLKFVDIFYK